MCLFVVAIAINERIAIITIIIVENAKCIGEDTIFLINWSPILLILSKNRKYATISALIAVITTPPAATSLAILAFGWYKSVYKARIVYIAVLII